MTMQSMVFSDAAIKRTIMRQLTEAHTEYDVTIFEIDAFGAGWLVRFNIFPIDHCGSPRSLAVMKSEEIPPRLRSWDRVAYFDRDIRRCWDYTCN